MRILTVFGTRPEAIKLAPVIHKFEQTKEIRNFVCNTAQHKELLSPILEDFSLKINYNLDVMQPGQSLQSLTCRILEKFTPVVQETRPDYILVQGDTTTAFIAGLVGFYQKVKIAHLEAGLRSNDLLSPWPEEANRRFLSVLADVHFCPTNASRDCLLKENVLPEKILVIGNTVIDALYFTKNKIETTPEQYFKPFEKFSIFDNSKRTLLVTLHRRENHGKRLEQICQGISDFIKVQKDAQVILSVHENPAVKSVIQNLLGNMERVHLISPPGYSQFVALMMRSYLILTDSGGIQEEAPSLNIPVLVTRIETERHEGIENGCAELVGVERESVYKNLREFYSNTSLYQRYAQALNPYGDGMSSNRVVDYFLKDTAGC